MSVQGDDTFNDSEALAQSMDLALSLHAAAPPPSLKERLMARIASEPPPNAGLGVLRRDETSWKPTGFAGATYRKLYFDKSTGLMTTLLKLEPGSKWPGHYHRKAEQCLILEGEIRHPDGTFIAGDFIWAETGSTDPLTTTTTGALLLIISDPADEFIEA